MGFNETFVELMEAMIEGGYFPLIVVIHFMLFCFFKYYLIKLIAELDEC